MNDPSQRIAELEEQVRTLAGGQRDLEERVKELEPRRKYVATLGEWFWREVQVGRS
jgi:hypothetical protein